MSVYGVLTIASNCHADDGVDQCSDVNSLISVALIADWVTTTL